MRPVHWSHRRYFKKKNTLVQIADSPYMAFLIDGDTDIATKECVIVYGRILRKRVPVNILLPTHRG